MCHCHITQCHCHITHGYCHLDVWSRLWNRLRHILWRRCHSPPRALRRVNSWVKERITSKPSVLLRVAFCDSQIDREDTHHRTQDWGEGRATDVGAVACYGAFLRPLLATSFDMMGNMVGTLMAQRCIGWSRMHSTAVAATATAVVVMQYKAVESTVATVSACAHIVLSLGRRRHIHCRMHSGMRWCIR